MDISVIMNILMGVVIIGVILNQMLLSRRIARLAEWHAAANNEILSMKAKVWKY